MRAKREVLAGQDSLQAFDFELPAFEFNWHYHTAYELTWIREGRGKRYVGDAIADFQRNDLVLVRSGVPHTWHSEPVKGKLVSALVIHFPERLVEPLQLFPEWQGIFALFQTGVGMQFSSSAGIRKVLEGILRVSPAEQLVQFYVLLHQLSLANPNALHSAVYAMDQDLQEQRRISIVLQYIHQHADKAITLAHLGSLIGLSEGAFCRFFKRCTQQTPMQYVMEWRMRRAAQYLLETDTLVGEIAGLVGFNSQAYFTRMFVQHFSCTPVAFRNRN